MDQKLSLTTFLRLAWKDNILWWWYLMIWHDDQIWCIWYATDKVHTMYCHYLVCTTSLRGFWLGTYRNRNIFPRSHAQDRRETGKNWLTGERVRTPSVNAYTGGFECQASRQIMDLIRLIDDWLIWLLIEDHWVGLSIYYDFTHTDTVTYLMNLM